jgi:alcohol dehydrogenase class IV
MMFARESMRLCAQHMVAAYRDGSSIEARTGMAYASVYAALSYGSAGLNAVHGIAYAVAGLTHKSHGATNAVVLPYVIDALRDVRRRELLDIATLFGLPTAHGAADEAQALRALPLKLRELVGQLDIPTDLRAFGIAEHQLDALSADALAVARLLKAFPVPDAAARYRRIVRNAYDGRLGQD